MSMTMILGVLLVIGLGLSVGGLIRKSKLLKIVGISTIIFLLAIYFFSLTLVFSSSM